MTTYAYDAHGYMTRKTQPDAGTTRYKYDRLHTVRFSQSAQQARGTAGAHRADAAAEITTRIAYDREGRVTHRRVAIEGLPEKDVFYSYDLAGKVTAMVYPDGGEVHYAYDAAGRLAGVTDAEENALAAYGYDHDGRMTTHKVGHAVGGALATGAYAYNARDWVSRIDYPGRFTLSQAYDAVGNVTSQNYRRAATEALKTATYAYDGLHRLKSVSLGAAHARSYAYDDNGNVTHVATGGDTATYAYSRGSTPNRLDSITQGSTTDRFTYNANGSATQVAGTAMAYDHRGLLTGYGAHAYTLDAEGYRVKKTGGGSTVYYIRGAGGSVLATYDGAGSLTAAYVYAGGDRLAKVAGGVVSYYLKDHLGSTRTLISSEGMAEATYDYWPYGEVLASSGTGSTHFRFTGHERDSESGLDYMLARSYAYDVGRFLRPDPMQDAYPGISPYAYANNNPLKYVDPDGNSHHEPQDQYDVNQIVQDRFDEGGVEVANAIVNLPSYVKSGAQEGAEVVAEHSLDLAETSVKSGIVISDALADGSTKGVLVGSVGALALASTRSPQATIAAVRFTSAMVKLGTASSVSSTLLKSTDALAFDGSYEAAANQVLKTAFGIGASAGTRIVAGRFLTGATFSGAGTLYRSASTGGPVPNLRALTSTAIVDATNAGLNFSAESLIDR